MTEGELKKRMQKVSGTQIIGYEGPPVPTLNLAEATRILDEAKTNLLARLQEATGNVPHGTVDDSKLRLSVYEQWFKEQFVEGKENAKR